MENIAVIVVGLILTAIIGVGALFAGGIFVVVVGLIAFAWLFCAVALYFVRTRNPMRPPHLGITERYADGQPLDRSDHHVDMEEQNVVSRMDEARLADAERQRLDAQRALEDEDHDPRDYEGPPPVVPFP